MHFLLSAIGSLSILGSGAASLATTHNVLPNNQSVSPLKERRIWFGGDEPVKISSNQGERVWKLSFNLWDLEPGESITKIRFDGAPLRSYVGWGGDHWEHSFTELSIINSAMNFAFYDDHWDGIANAVSYLGYTINRLGTPNDYELIFRYYTRAFWSFNGSWGDLTIGNSITFIY